MRLKQFLMNRWSAPAVGLGLMFALAAPGEAAGPINVTQLTGLCPMNADGVNPNDDTQAFLCAIALVPAGGAGEIYIPAGTYTLSSQLTVSNKSIAFRGEGQRITNLLFVNLPGGHNGLDFESANIFQHQPFAVRSLSVLRGNGEGGAAIRAQWPHTPVGGRPAFTNGGGMSITIEDVHIGTDSWTSSGPYWHRGIWLHNARFAKIQSFNIHGLSQVPAGVAGIHISGSLPSGASPTIGVTIHDGSILGYVRGVHAVENTRGLNAQNLKIRDAYYGFELSGTDAGNSIANCHIFARSRGITVYNTLGDMAISNNVIYRDGTAEFYGIELNTGPAGPMPRMRIIGNTIMATATGSARYGISLANSVEGAVIQGNTTHDMTNGIWLVNGAVTGTVVVGNINRTGGTPIVNLGTNTYWTDNW